MLFLSHLEGWELCPPSDYQLSSGRMSRCCLSPVFTVSDKRIAAILDVFFQPRKNQLVIESVEALRNVALDKPDGSSRVVVDFSERGMTSASRAETMRVLAELSIEVGIQDHAYHFGQEFVAPDRQTQRALAPILFGDIDSSGRFPLIAFRPQQFDDRIDLVQRHCVYGFVGHAGRHRTSVAVDATVGGQIEVFVEQLSIHSLERQTLFASLMKKFQVCVGDLHCACLDMCELRDTSPAHLYQRARSGPPSRVAASPCTRLVPCSDYYRGSDLIGLASRRGSHVYAHETLSTVRCPSVPCQAHSLLLALDGVQLVPSSLPHFHVRIIYVALQRRRFRT